MYSCGTGWAKGREHAQCCWCLVVIKALHAQGASLPCGPSKFTITGRAYAISPSQSHLKPFIKHLMGQTSVHPETGLILRNGGENLFFSCGARIPHENREVCLVAHFTDRFSNVLHDKEDHRYDKGTTLLQIGESSGVAPWALYSLHPRLTVVHSLTIVR